MGRKSQNKKINAQNDRIRAVNGLLLDAFNGRGLRPGFGSEVESALTMLYNTRSYLVTNQGALLSSVYATNGIIRKFIEMPVQDALNSGFEIKTSQLDDSEILAVENKMMFEGDIENLQEAIYWKRVFGGGGLITVTDNESKTAFDEVEVAEGKPLYFKPFSKWDLTTEGTNDLYGDPFEWDNFYSKKFKYFGKEVDRSRMFLLKGATATTEQKLQTGGWGLSEIESVVAHINTFIKTTQLIFEIMSEYKVDVIAIKDLHSIMMSAPDEIHKRAQEMAAVKDSKSMLVIDKEDAFYTRNLQFSGIPEILSKNEHHLCALFRIPATRFWGISASGFSSGNEDLEAYNVMLKNSIQVPAHPIVLKMVQLRCMQLFGVIPSDLEIKWNPFRDETIADSELRRNGEHARLMEARRDGIISDEQYKEAVNKSGLLPIKL